MSFVGFFMGFVDFKSSLPLDQVAELLSSEIFGGIKFIEKDVDEDYNLGYYCLEKSFLGVQVDLCTDDKGGYSLELGTAISTEGIEGVASVDPLLKQFIQRISEFELTDPEKLL